MPRSSSRECSGVPVAEQFIRVLIMLWASYHLRLRTLPLSWLFAWNVMLALVDGRVMELLNPMKLHSTITNAYILLTWLRITAPIVNLLTVSTSMDSIRAYTIALCVVQVVLYSWWCSCSSLCVVIAAYYCCW